jgi:dTDP-4-dehydrorhamnose 3,5-epimerase
MALAVERFDIDGLLLVRPQKFSDSRGHFISTYDLRQYRDAGIDCTFVKDNQSLSRRKGTIRGLHFQVPPAAQVKLVRVSRGSIFDVAVDLRKGSPTYGQWRAITLGAEDGAQFFLPVGFAHGFCTLEPDSEVAYKTDAFYAPECDTGLRWDDPDIGVKWPISAGEAVISNKDASLPAFKTFISPFSM